MKKDKEMIEIEKKIKIKNAMDEMQAFVTKSEAKKEELLDKARKAKARNDSQSYKLACMGLASTMASKKKAEQMLLSMEVIISLKDISKMTTGFLSCMETLSKEVGVLAKNNKFGKVSKEFNKAMAEVNMQSDGLENLMEDLSMSSDNLDLGISSEFQQEIEKMLEQDIISNESELDLEIDKKLEQMKKKIK